MLAGLAVAGWILPAANLEAQEVVATNSLAPIQAPVKPAVKVPAPRLSPGAWEILQLTQAKLGADTILAYIKGTRLNYALDAKAIIYLRAQGVSEAIITAMLLPLAPVTNGTNAPSASTTVLQPAPAPQPVAAATMTTIVEVPTTVYVETPAPETVYYSQPTYNNYYYPVYGYIAPASYGVSVYGRGGNFGGNHGGVFVGGHGGGNFVGGHPGGNGNGNVRH